MLSSHPHGAAQRPSAGEWVLAGTGAVPGMMGALRYGTYTIAVTNDESTPTPPAPPDSPILKTKGYNKDYPEVYGHPDDVRGKTFSSPPCPPPLHPEPLAPRARPQGKRRHHQEHRSGAGPRGVRQRHRRRRLPVGTAHVLRYRQGWKVAGTPNTCGVGLPRAHGRQEVLRRQPELVAKFLRVFLRSANMLQKETRNPRPEYCASSRNSWARALRRKWPRSTSRRTPFSTLKNSSPCSTAPRGRARPPSGWPTSPNFSPAWADHARRAEGGQGRLYATDKFLKLVKQPSRLQVTFRFPLPCPCGPP